jgi:hypothetical protein
MSAWLQRTWALERSYWSIELEDRFQYRCNMLLSGWGISASIPPRMGTDTSIVEWPIKPAWLHEHEFKECFNVVNLTARSGSYTPRQLFRAFSRNDHWPSASHFWELWSPAVVLTRVSGRSTGHFGGYCRKQGISPRTWWWQEQHLETSISKANLQLKILKKKGILESFRLVGRGPARRRRPQAARARAAKPHTPMLKFRTHKRKFRTPQLKMVFPVQNDQQVISFDSA